MRKAAKREGMKIRIGLIHAVSVAIDPVQIAFASRWPDATLTNLLDDSLSPDLEREGVLTPAMRQRIQFLTSYVADTGADGILFTCSAFGEAIAEAAARAAIPVLKPNEAMFEAAIESGQRIGMLATFGPAVASMEQEFAEMAGRRGSKACLDTYCVPGALEALRNGDFARHNRLVAAASPRFKDYDVLLLAHFSTSRASTEVAKVVGRAPLTSPESAVLKLRREISRRGSTP
jgi:hypothetical protein